MDVDEGVDNPYDVSANVAVAVVVLPLLAVWLFCPPTSTPEDPRALRGVFIVIVSSPPVAAAPPALVPKLPLLSILNKRLCEGVSAMFFVPPAAAAAATLSSTIIGPRVADDDDNDLYPPDGGLL